MTVASYADAWIEIDKDKKLIKRFMTVASYADAWIEIFWIFDSVNRNGVASYADAWIEILSSV